MRCDMAIGFKKPAVAGQGSCNHLIQLRWAMASCKWPKQHAECRHMQCSVCMLL